MLSDPNDASLAIICPLTTIIRRIHVIADNRVFRTYCIAPRFPYTYPPSHHSLIKPLPLQTIYFQANVPVWIVNDPDLLTIQEYSISFGRPYHFTEVMKKISMAFPFRKVDFIWRKVLMNVYLSSHLLRILEVSRPYVCRSNYSVCNSSTFFSICSASYSFL